MTSTNEVVKHALEEGEPEGLAVRARCQSGGYGRQGRTWASPEGGLYLSLLLRPHVPPAQLPTLSLVAGLAVREAAVALAGGALAGRILISGPTTWWLRKGMVLRLRWRKATKSMISDIRRRRAATLLACWA